MRKLGEPDGSTRPPVSGCVSRLVPIISLVPPRGIRAVSHQAPVEVGRSIRPPG
jgi:hypothetical protein